MASRLEESSTIVSWTVTRRIRIGYHTCDNCERETPSPTMAEMIEWAQQHERGGFMLPDAETWTPVGWSFETVGLLCPDCIEACRAALATRREGADTKPEHTHGEPKSVQQGLGITDRARLAIDVVIQDLLDRRGLKREWTAIDEDVKAQIRKHWVAIVERRFTDLLPETTKAPARAGADTKPEG